ncbi:threonyl-tRNA synthetase, partial [Cryomyces antarcticus]
ISQEILGLFDFLKTVYDLFGFTFKMKLSTRPEGFLGEVETWDNAEARLKEALDGFCNENNMKWDLNPGDGAFYGPKIDIKISDALKRDHQCATIQLDFQLPQQFNLEYVTGEASSKPKTDGAEAENKEKPDVKKEAKKEVKVASLDELRQARKQKKLKISDIAENCGIEEEVCFRIFDGTAEASAQDLTKLSNLLCGDPLGAPNYRKQLTPGYARPVMIHRAIFGSFERFMAILMEHFAGRWPFWLSPRQVLVVPVMPSVNDYVLEVQALFDEHDINIDVDVSADTMKAKIRNGQLAQYNFIFVVGAQEKESRTVNIRNRDDQATQAKGELIPLDEALEKMLKLRDSRALENKL